MEILRWAGVRWVTSVPPMVIVPPSSCSSPAISRSVVDLPQPDGPSSTSSEPSSAVRLTSSTARIGPQFLET